MASFSKDEIDWRCPDVFALLHHAGILSVLPADVDEFLMWLTVRRYAIHTVDFGLGFVETLRQLGELFRWEEEFGYRLETRSGNSNALRDGFEFQAVAGGRIALLVLRPDTLLDRGDWILHFLAIAAEHSTYHLALGSRFLTILSIPQDSPLVGVEFEPRGVASPLPLRLPRSPEQS